MRCGWRYASLPRGERGLCAVCSRPYGDCDGQTCQPPTPRIDLRARLIELGRRAARDAWAEQPRRLARIPRSPGTRAWSMLGAGIREVEPDRVLGGAELLVFVRAYRQELGALSARKTLLQPGEHLELGGSGDGLVRAVVTRNGQLVAVALDDKAERAVVIAVASARAADGAR